MIYYPRHIGDCMRDSAELSLTEEGVYTRLADHYFSREEPLPLDFKTCCRIARAISRAERAAVQRVLDRLFERRESGFHKTAFDSEIGRFQSKSLGRSRAAKSRWDKERSDAIALQKDSTSTAIQQPTSNNQQKSTTPITLPASTPARDASPQRGERVTVAGEACRLMREAGATQTNPSHPDLLAALAEGCTPQELADTVAEAVASGKTRPFPWAIKTTRDRRARVANGQSAVTFIPRGSNHAAHRQAHPPRCDRVEQRNRNLDEREQREAQALGSGAIIEHAR